MAPYTPPSPERREFLRQAALLGITIATPFEALLARQQRAMESREDALGYGPIAPVRDEATGLPLLELPAGFRYISFGWTGDPLEGGGRTPGAHDGMAAFGGQGNRVRLVRNHEVTTGPAFASRDTYDRAAGGGTVTLEFDAARGAWVGGRASLAGTIRNCAGGPTPWGSWLTCEETLLEPGPSHPFRERHGYIFEVPLDGRPSREPLEAMGRFVHEAIAVDPKTGAVYETEDSADAGLYRFTPKKQGELDEGGRLEMLAIAGRPQFDTRGGQPAGVEYPITWVPIDDPDRAHRDPALADGGGVFSQGWAGGGAVFARLEGAWYSGGNIYVTATSGGAAKMGQVWEIDPNRAVLRLVYESPGAELLNMPDNLCASPRGGLVLCEDGTANPSMHGLSLDGKIFRFARNNILLNGETRGFKGDYRSGEFAGATFSPDGQWLFVNIQSPGVTFAITGPWAKGLL